MLATGTRVLLVSYRPHLSAQVRLGIESRPGLVVAGEADNYDGAMAIAASENPDFIVVDMAAGDEVALKPIADLAQSAKHVLVVSDACQESVLNCLRQQGGVDLVPRQQVVGEIIKRLDDDREEACILTLTSQELAVVELVGRGLSNKKIARRLWVSEAVVAEALDSIYQKLEVRDRFELLIYGLYYGLWRAAAPLHPRPQDEQRPGRDGAGADHPAAKAKAANEEVG